MDQTRELAKASVQASSMEGFAIKTSIFLAVLFLGAYIFFQHFSQLALIQEIEDRASYHFVLQDVGEDLVQELQKDVPERVTLRQELLGSSRVGTPLYRVEVTCKNVRDAYFYCRDFLESIGEDERLWLKEGKVLYNTDLLESRGVFPNGFIPSGEWFRSHAVNFLLLLLLFLLFASLIYSAFFQWQQRKQKELALLQSVGMVGRQLWHYNLWRSFYLSRFPLILGMPAAYALAVLFQLFIWRTAQAGYETYAWNFDKNYAILRPRVLPFLFLLILSLLCIGLASWMSSKAAEPITIVEAMRPSWETSQREGQLSCTFPSLERVNLPWRKGRKVRKGSEADHRDSSPFKKPGSKRPEVSLARTFRSFYGKRDRRWLLFFIIGAFCLAIFMLNQAYTALVTGQLDQGASHEMKLTFWYKGELAEELEGELRRLEKDWGVQIDQLEGDGLKYIEMTAKGKTGREISALEGQIRKRLSRYFDAGHWVGIGSLEEGILDKTREEVESLQFAIGCLAILLLGASYIFQQFLNNFSSRARELTLLGSVGMTEGQIRNMLVWEGFLVLGKLFLVFLIELLLLSFFFTLKSGWEFKPWQILSKIKISHLFLCIIPLVAGLIFAVRFVLKQLRNGKRQYGY